jgi:hypothetical protein
LSNISPKIWKLFLVMVMLKKKNKKAMVLDLVLASVLVLPKKLFKK